MAHQLLTPAECGCFGDLSLHCNICVGGLAYCIRCLGGECELDEDCDERIRKAGLRFIIERDDKGRLIITDAHKQARPFNELLKCVRELNATFTN